MPVYDFVCVKCGAREDRRVPFGEQDNQKCIVCNSKMIVRIHPVASMWGKGGKPIERKHSR